MNSWHLATVSGIKLRVHWTFLILPVYIYLTSVSAGLGAVAALQSVLLLFAIFGCVVLHELGHALAARQFGISTRDITLLPIGGVAALERMPSNPWQELWIAVAGPLVNVVIASFLLLGMLIAGQLGSLFSFGFIAQLTLANIALVVFNMIPAFPMDGGRVLRSIAALFTDRITATRIAVAVGRVAAIGLGLLGIVSGNIFLALIAVFVYFAGSAELNQLVMMQQQSQQGVGGGIWADEPGTRVEESASVPSTLPTSAVLAWMGDRKADLCLVVESGKVIGQLTRAQIVSALAAGAGHLPVGNLIRT
jgi:Zn-dependent protease